MNTRTIPSAIVKMIADSANPHEGWLRVSDQFQENTRWSERHLLVVQDPQGALWGVEYLLGLTEDQEHDLPWLEDDEVVAERVYPHRFAAVEYRLYPQEEPADA